MLIDLYSDTATQPSEGMRRAMASAPVGNGPVGEDTLTNTLVEKVADILGKEAAIFLPTGTMCNAISYRYHCRPGDEVIADKTCHSIHSEAGGASALSGVLFAVVNGRRGLFSGTDVEALVRHPPSPIRPRSRMVVIEQTSMRAGGAVWPVLAIEEVAAIAKRYGLAVHMDGARLFNAVARTGSPAHAHAGPCDSVWIDFSKGLGAPVGAVLAGSKEFIEECWRWNAQFGGAMRKPGILAAACLYALEHNVERLAEDNDNARWLARELSQIDGIEINPAEVDSNILIFDVKGVGVPAAILHDLLLHQGVRVGVFGKWDMRVVTHLNISREQLTTVVMIFDRLISSVRSGEIVCKESSGAGVY